MLTLRHTYTLFAPIYDALIERASREPRRRSLLGLSGQRVLLVGVGSGLDIPHLPEGPAYVGIDLTPAMLQRARRRAEGRHDIALHVGNAMALPYPDDHFDAVVMHLILAVVPQPEQALREAERVLSPGGSLRVLDKFLRPGQRAPLRRAVNHISRHIATRTDVVFERLLAQAPSLTVVTDRPALAGGWFRQIELMKHPAGEAATVGC